MRLGDGWVIEFAEWCCRTYGYKLREVVEMPLSDMAILYRCNAHGQGYCKSGTFQADDAADEFANLLPKEN